VNRTAIEVNAKARHFGDSLNRPPLVCAQLLVLALGASCAAPRSAAEAALAPVAAAPGPAVVAAATLGPVELAITFDDLPAHGPAVPGLSRLQLHQQILAALARHGVPQAYGFVNAGPVAADPALLEPLQAWVAAGQPLGNHTFGHESLESLPLPQWLEGIDRDEPLLRQLQPGPEARWRVFRFPFLERGRTLEERAAIRDHLQKLGYRIAEVTDDFSDWAFNEPFSRCLAKGDAAALEQLRQAFLHQAQVELAFSDGFLRRLFGRPVPHVLLLHAGAHTALRLDELLTLYQRAGVRFVPLDRALADPVYALDPQVAPARGDTLLGELADERGLLLLPWPQLPEKALEKLCR
jgi:peptidoglycan/xylan/chitin deacetylase (PgdA/CDA1 family)